MKLILSELWAELLAHHYNGQVRYSHINKYGMWEFTIEGTFGTLYKSKGIKNGKN